MMSTLREFPPSCKWDATDALNILSVQYVRAPFGPDMPGQSVHTAYLNLLHQIQDERRDILGLHACRHGAATSTKTNDDVHDACATMSMGTATAGRPGPGHASTPRPAESMAAPSSSAASGSHGSPRSAAWSGLFLLETEYPRCPMITEKIGELQEVFEVFSSFDIDAFDSTFFNLIRQSTKVKCARSGSFGDPPAAACVGVTMPTDGSGRIMQTHGHGDENVVDSSIEGFRHCDMQDPDEPSPISKALDSLNLSFRRLEREKERLKRGVLSKKYTMDYVCKFIERYHSLSKFINGVRRLLRQVSANSLSDIDEAFFTQLFIDFGWIFSVDFRLVSAFRPLMICGEEISSRPDLIYNQFTDGWANQYLVVTVAENVVLNLTSQRSHDLRKRSCSGSEIEYEEGKEDSAILPPDLRGQHACQLVRALPYTNAQNKMCVLGFIVQATKVRLTCLMMEKDHRDSLQHKDYNPADFEAKIFYTRAYEMLNAKDRLHLINILVALECFE